MGYPMDLTSSVFRENDVYNTPPPPRQLNIIFITFDNEPSRLQTTQPTRCGSVTADTSHRHYTTPPLPALVQAPYPLPTYTTHTTATKTQTHVQHAPCPQRIGKAQNQFSHPLTPPPSPPTPPLAKHIHMSHTPPTLLTSTSPVLDKTPEPRVPLIHALTATHLTRTPRQHCLRQPHKQTNDYHRTTNTKQSHRPRSKVREISSYCKST